MKGLVTARFLSVGILAPIALLVLHCRPARPSSAYELLVRVTSGTGQPLAGAKVSFQGKAVGKSDQEGKLKLAVQGSEGEVVALIVTCPEGYRSPPKTLDVSLRRLADPGRPPEFSVNCPPLRRTVVVAVRADNGPNLPVLLLGEEVARTDISGAAHVLLTLAPADEIELVVDTGGDGAAKRLRPKNPSFRFTVKDEDEVLSFYVPFTVQPDKGIGPRRVARPDLPIRI